MNQYIEEHPKLDCPKITKGVVFYIRKGYPDWKEFVIEFDQDMFDQEVARTWRAKKINILANDPKSKKKELESIVGETLEEFDRDSICVSKGCKRASKCPYKNECFSE